MNDLILITVSAIGGGIVGFFACAVLTAAKVGDLEEQCEQTIFWYNRAESLIDEWGESEAAHTRCADALAAKNDRIDRALACVTENSAHVGKKMARILRGDA